MTAGASDLGASDLGAKDRGGASDRNPYYLWVSLNKPLQGKDAAKWQSINSLLFSSAE